MSSPAAFIASLVSSLVDSTVDLQRALEHETALANLLSKYGWVPPDLKPNVTASYFPDLQKALGVGDALTNLEELLNKPDLGVADIDALWKASDKILNTLRDVSSVAQKSATWPAPFNKGTQFWQPFLSDVVNGFLFEYLEIVHPAIMAPLNMFGVADKVIRTSPGGLTYEQRSFHWEVLPRLFAGPSVLMQERYGWGGPTLDYQQFLTTLEKCLIVLGFWPRRNLNLGLQDQYYGASSPSGIEELRIPFVRVEISYDVYSEVGLLFFPIPKKPNPQPSGLLVSLYSSGEFEEVLDVGAGWQLNVSGHSATDRLLGFEVFPSSVSMPSSTTGGDVSCRLSYQPEDPWRVIGDATLAAVEVDLALNSSRNECRFGLAAKEFNLQLDFAKSDSFLGRIFGQQAQRVTFTGELVWSSVTGLGFNGQGNLRFQIPLNQKFEIAEIDLLTIGVDLRKNDQDPTLVQAFAGVSGSATIGPIKVAIDQVGVAFPIISKPGSGLFGDLSIDIKFKPPVGAGIVIDAGPVTGGGYLFYSDDGKEKRYGGILQLRVPLIDLKAVGLITTSLPNGKKGISFLIIVTVGGFRIQLGFGFALTSLGALFGYNRSANIDVIQAGLKNGILNSTLSLPDPITNAASIITNLEGIYPPTENRYVFGPLIEIDWGTPSIIRCYLALVLELPMPIRLLILGQVKADLPTTDVSLVRFRMDILGVIDFVKGEFLLEASLYDSRVLSFSLSGGMALEVAWGARPVFLLSLGGFHPLYPAPAGFPKIDRLAIGLSSGNSIQMHLDAYFALTSNSVQFGSHFTLLVQVAKFSLSGYLAFDALIQFSPFHFQVDIAAGLALKYKYDGPTFMAVAVALSLSGPAPWHAKGKAKITLLFIDVSLSFDLTFGASAPPIPPPQKSAIELLTCAIADRKNWRVVPANGAPFYISFNPQDARDTTSLLLYPQGLLEFSQRAVPLNFTIEKYGNAVLSEGPCALDLSITGFDSPGSLYDSFAPGQYLPLNDTDRIIGPAYVPLKSGITVGSNSYQFYAPPNVTLDQYKPPEYTQPFCYNMILVNDAGTKVIDCLVGTGDCDAPLPSSAPTSGITGNAIEHHHRVNAHARAPIRRSGLNKFPADPLPVDVNEPEYEIATTDDLVSVSVPASVAPSAGTQHKEQKDYYSVRRRLATMLRNPNSKGRFQMVRSYETPPKN